MKRRHAPLLVALLAAAAFAVDIDVGGTRLSIPAPPGYTTLGDAQPYAGMLRSFVPPQNEQYAVFLTAGDVETAARGEVPEPSRFFYVQTAKSVVHRTATLEDFEALKTGVQKQNARLAEAIEKEIPGLINRVNEQVRKDHAVDLGLSMNQVVPLPPHDESDRTLAFSMLTSYEMTDAEGNAVSWDASVTATFVHVKGKVVFLYAVGERADLAWSREASREWAAAVVAANPSTGAIAERERQRSKRGFDWGRVGVYAIVGAVIGGVIGLARLLAGGRKKG